MGLKLLQKPSIQPFINRRNPLILLFSIGFAILAGLFGLFIGSVHVSIETIVKIIAQHAIHIHFKSPIDFISSSIIWDIRLPRMLVAFLVGASLSLAGVTFQGILRNPLADPYTIGVSSGGSLVAVISIFFKWTVFGLSIMLTVTTMSIVGALATVALVISIANWSHTKLANESIVLAGIITSSFAGAIITLLISLSNKNQVSTIIFWLMGTFEARTWTHVAIVFVVFLLGSFYLLLRAKQLQLLMLGDTNAAQLGVAVQREKKGFLLVAACLTGASVAVAGAIGFIGLIVPHFVRLLVGNQTKLLLPISLFIGGGYLVLADLIARTLIQPSELPVGVITAIVGAPIFTWLYIQTRRKKVRL
jgi:iron complex transport system permease protein